VPAGKRRAVFLDRDGVLMPDRDYLADPKGVRAYAGAAEALKRLRAAGFKIVVVSNQSGIARGYFGWRELRAVNAELARQLKRRGARWDALYVSPHGPKSRHPWRKPGTGMLRAAARRLRFDLRASYLVGDKTSDIECGRRAGCVTMLVRTGKAGRDRAYRVKPDLTTRDLLSAARWIVRQTTQQRKD
jgi:D-glycero-D-manno-heptose 1,7-bisphosphate phosphatase